MTGAFRASLRLARSLTYCLMTVCVATGAQAGDILAWRDATSVEALMDHLEEWLDHNTDLPRRDLSPAVRWTTQAAVPFLTGSTRAARLETIKGLYDAENATIWLVRPWSARDPRDVSVLLHELVHHRQVGAQHWYCPGAQELPAYRAQEAWLAELGLELNVNDISVAKPSLDAKSLTKDAFKTLV